MFPGVLVVRERDGPGLSAVALAVPGEAALSPLRSASAQSAPRVRALPPVPVCVSGSTAARGVGVLPRWSQRGMTAAPFSPFSFSETIPPAGSARAARRFSTGAAPRYATTVLGAVVAAKTLVSFGAPRR